MSYDYRDLASKVREYLETATGDSTDYILQELIDGEDPYGMLEKYRAAKAYNGYDFDEAGWVADELYSNISWVRGLAGDYICEVIQNYIGKLALGSEEFKGHYNAIVDALALQVPHASELILELKFA